MSNRNFDSRVIIQRLQALASSNNTYNYNSNGRRIINNPQTSLASFGRITDLDTGRETTYQQSLQGTYTSSTSGILNVVIANNQPTPVIIPSPPSPPPPPTPPSGLPAASLWFDPSDLNNITLNGQYITSFNDKTVNNNDGFATSNGSIQNNSLILYNVAPINGLGTVRIDNSGGIKQLLKVNSYNFNDQFISYAIIVNYRSGSSGFVATDTPGLFGRGIGVDGTVNPAKAQTISYNAFTTWDGSPAPDLAIPADTPTIIIVSISAGNWTYSLNGTQYTLSLTQAKLPDNTQGLNIGCWNPTNAVSVIFDCGELLVYTSFLSTTEIEQVEGYLATKWGLLGNLPTNHPYKNGYP
jgi:hypothetical protein